MIIVSLRFYKTQHKQASWHTSCILTMATFLQHKPKVCISNSLIIFLCTVGTCILQRYLLGLVIMKDSGCGNPTIHLLHLVVLSSRILTSQQQATQGTPKSTSSVTLAVPRAHTTTLSKERLLQKFSQLLLVKYQLIFQ